MNPFFRVSVFLVAAWLAASVSVQAAGPNVKKALEELRAEVQRAGDAEERLRLPEPKADGEEAWLHRADEFLSAQQAVIQAESGFERLAGMAGPSRIWAEEERTEAEIAKAAEEFLAGPNGEVSPSNGELLLAFEDAVLSGRAGLGFAFRRTYSSFRRTDSVWGPGWDCNWTPRLVFRAGNGGEPSVCEVHLGGRSFSFMREGGVWTPPPGVFLELKTGSDAVTLLTPQRDRWMFERSEEIPDGWRLREVATRHDNWTANRMSVSYLSGCDRIAKVLDPFGRTVDFAYDGEGRIVQIATPFCSASYRYDPGTGLLLETETSPVAITVDRTVRIKQTFRYERAGEGWRLCGSESSARPDVVTEYAYDEAGRIVACSEKTGGETRTWSFRYGEGETRVEPPFPGPLTVYHYGKAPDPSLPDAVEIPARGAKTLHEWTPSLLPSRTIDPLGVSTVCEYDETNPLPFLRGTLLAERTIPAGERPSDWAETGTETDYAPGTALPETVRHYQIGPDGEKSVLKTEMWEYSEDGDPTLHDDGGLVERVAYNRFGLPAMEMDGNGNVTVHHYAAAFPEMASLDFQDGSPANGGPEVLSIEDATWKQMFEAGKAVGLRRLFRADHAGRMPAAARETRTAWTPWGDAIRKRCDRSERLSIRNASGMTLAECHFGHSLSVTEYRPGGEPESIFRLFDPAPEDSFKGRIIPRFSGRYFTESFRYDSFGALAGTSPTDEPGSGGEVPSYDYERLPGGEMAALVNPAGLRREDEYDGKTGWLAAQRIAGETESAVLYRVLSRYPNGTVQAWEDSFGGIWTNVLDGFGNVATVVHPNGVEEIQHRDGLGRTTEERFELDGRILSGAAYEYDPANGLLLCKKEWVDDAPGGPRFVVTSEFRYDGNGNAVAQREAKSDSWRFVLFDGLGREAAVLSPAGDIECTIYRDGLPGYVQSGLYSEREEGRIETGTIAAHDRFGRLAESIPVGADGEVKPLRRTSHSYDNGGRRVLERDEELTERRIWFDTQGRETRTETRPLNPLHGERTLAIRNAYLADGRLAWTATENDALGIFGKKNDALAAMVEAVDQKTQNDYDELGRLVSTIQPDGLTATRTYDSHSLPERMVWTHVAEPGIVLRDLRFRYTNEGLVESIADGLSKTEIARYEYDPLGRCVWAADMTDGSELGLMRTFNSLGDCTSETIRTDNVSFPSLAISLDYEKGTETRAWNGLEPSSPAFWTEEKLSRDAAGRLSSIELDSEGFFSAEWTHVGKLPETRVVRSCSCQWVYSPMLETKSVRFSGAGGGTISYEYGPQGQTWVSAVEFPGTAVSRGDFSFVSYTDSDAFRRHVAQNSERKAVPDALRRRSLLLGASVDSLAATRAERFLYDQAGNTTVRYNGTETGFNQLSRDANNPQYVSAASLLPGDGTARPGDLSLRELASNREATQASHGESGTLVAESRTYDLLGNVVSFQGTYWDGEHRYPVEWTNRWDVFGRLEHMEAFAREDVFDLKKGQVLAELRFRYDAANRRIEKTVTDMTVEGKKRTAIERTLYIGNEQKLVFREEDGEDILIGEYLWGEQERELLMATLRPLEAENRFSKTPVRYCFQQDAGMNVVRVLREENGGVSTVSTAGYLGFGENATCVPIRGIRSSMNSLRETQSYNGDLDDADNARWTGGTSGHFLALDLESAGELSELDVWTGSLFPKDFLVFVLEPGEDIPANGHDVPGWAAKHADRCVAAVANGMHRDATEKKRVKRDTMLSPYRISLCGAWGSRIVLVWNSREYDGAVEVREFEVVRTPPNPAPIAFAGQWLDRETGLYYQINRYREAGSEKFLSPDPLGFLGGPNLYAYANDNPLEWHDPDGRWANVLVGAGLGALFGGGGYVLSTWWNDGEFSWREFAIQTLVGAAAGAVAGATFGVCLPAAGGGFWGMVGAGTASGASGGLVQGALDGALHGEGFGSSMYAGAKGAVVGAVAGAVGGGVVKGISMPKTISVFGLKLSRGVRGFLTAGGSGFAAGGAGGATSGLISGFETGDFSRIGPGALKGALTGAVSGMAVHGVLAGYEQARGITWDKSRQSYWKEEARRNPDKWSSENLARMRQGNAPQRINPKTGQLESMELHHNGISRRAGLSRLVSDQRGNLKQVWPDEHRAIDPYRK